MMSYAKPFFILLTLLLPLFFAGCKSHESHQDKLQLTHLLKFSINQFMTIYSSSGIQIGTNGFGTYSTWTTGVKQIYQWKNSQNVQISFFEEGVDWYSLSPDGKQLVAGVGKGGNEQTKLWLYDTTSKKWSSLPFEEKAKYGGINWHQSSRWFYYYSNEDNPKDFHLYRYDLATKKGVKFLSQQGINYVYDSNQTGDQLIIIRYVSNEEQRPFLYNAKKQELTPILWEKGKKARFSSIFFSADEKELYLNTDLLSDNLNPAIYNIQTHKLSPIVTNATKSWEVVNFECNEERNQCAFITNEDGYRKAYITSPDSEWKTKPFHPFGDGLYSISKITANKIFFTFENAKQTQDAFYINYINRDFKENKAVQCTFSDTQGIPLAQFSLPKLIHYSSFDQLKIPAFLYLPPNYQPGLAIPFIIQAHGGPESQFRPGFNRHFQYLLSRGYGILAPNVRGSSGYGKHYMSLDNYKKRKDAIKDYYYATQWLLDNGYTRKGKLGIKGGSYGGYVVMAMITEYPDLFSVAVNNVGIVNFVTFLQKTKAYRRGNREKEYGPLSDIPFLKSVSPIHKIYRIKTPLLVVHGKNDPRVSIHEAEQIITELKKRNRVVEKVIFDDEGHGVRKLSNRLIYYNAMVNWLDKYLVKK